MKDRYLFRKGTLIQCGVIATTLGVSVWQSPAQIVTLTDNNSVAQIDTGTSSGMFNWSVDGSPQLFQQWFWLRVGAVGGEAPINTIGAPANTTPTARDLTSIYNNGSYSVRVAYQLNGGAINSGTSGMSEAIRIENLTAGPLDFHFFQYTDFDLGGAGNNTTVLSQNLFTGRYTTADQVGPGGVFQETLATPGANRAEAGIFPNTVNSLNDASTTTLNNNLNAGPGDTTYAFQWDVTIVGGGSFEINKALSLQLTNVPEPSALALISLGLAGVALRKRRTSV